MTTVTKGNQLVRLINVFAVEPENQQKLVDLLALASESSVRHTASFESASFHRNLDGSTVTMNAQWRSIEDYNAVRKNDATSPYLDQARRRAKFEPGMYEVAAIFGLEGKNA